MRRKDEEIVSLAFKHHGSQGQRLLIDFGRQGIWTKRAFKGGLMNRD
jgi:hypothetical protein